MGAYKLIEFFEGSRVELYDLDADFGEIYDLSSSQPQRVEALRRALHERQGKVRDRFPTLNPGWQEAAPPAATDTCALPETRTQS